MRRFTKMHGLGNDFVVFDATVQPLILSPEQARHIADRHTGIGCDQILIVDPSDEPAVDFGYRILNSDGSESGQCGNGARCFARFVREKGLTSADEIRVKTVSGLMDLIFEADGQIKVNMGQPQFAPQAVPLNIASEERSEYELSLKGFGDIQFKAVSMGNPHAVITVADVDATNVSAIGPAMQADAMFPESANIGFSEMQSRSEIRLRVFERGVGETLACGSGACAAVAVGRRDNKLDQNVRVNLPGGTLSIEWAGIGSDMWMTGPAVTVFSGEIDL